MIIFVDTESTAICQDRYNCEFQASDIQTSVSPYISPAYKLIYYLNTRMNLGDMTPKFLKSTPISIDNNSQSIITPS